MFNWGKSSAFYLVANQKKNCRYQAGNVFENFDELVKIESEEVSVGY
jgi:hypothetical protein